MRSFLCYLAVVFLAGCAGQAAGPVSPGSWGGDGVSLSVFDAGADVEFDCAHGRIQESLAIAQDGAFAAVGTFVFEHGGPVREGEVPDAHPAVYSGSLKGKTLTLTVRLTDMSTEIGPYSLQKNAPPNLHKCL